MKKWLLVAATLTLVALGVSATASGTVRQLLTGADIRNGSITSADIADRTLKSQDFSPGVAAALTGPEGPAGPQGDPGPQGETGAPGHTGATGDTGDTGPQGLVGPPGLGGLTGPMGLSGAPGLTGDTGATGATGADGPQGPAGPEGPQGPQGAIGPQGPAGADGHTGAAGKDGADGANGTNGVNGQDGAIGATGPAGPAGPAGPQGPQGPEGPAGKDGGVTFPALVDINPMPIANKESGWDRIIINGQSVNNGYRSTCCDDPSASGKYLEWSIPLAAGDWRLQAMYATDSDAGILTFSLDGNDIGTIDTYGSYNPQDSTVIGPFHVGSSGNHALRVRIDSKNADSAGAFGYLSWIRLVQN